MAAKLVTVPVKWTPAAQDAAHCLRGVAATGDVFVAYRHPAGYGLPVLWEVRRAGSRVAAPLQIGRKLPRVVQMWARADQPQTTQQAVGR